LRRAQPAQALEPDEFQVEPAAAIDHFSLSPPFAEARRAKFVLRALGEGLLPQIPNGDARGNAWQDLKNNERAIADHDMAIKLDPNDATA
jgi:hypothetical protein